MIAAAYIRVSTEDQIEFSPDSQLKRIQEYANCHEIQIPKKYIFIDEGISGRDARKRPAFQEMIRLARTEKPFQKILVWKFSRFARNRQDSIFYKSMLRKDCGIEVISITEPLSNDPTSILIEALLEAMDEYYSINLAQEVRRGMQERFTRGKAISIPPFGYQMGADTFEPHPEQAKWVEYIFRSYASGDSVQRIANALNGMGIRTNRGNPFQARTISYILLNPVYIGKLRKRKEGENYYDRYYAYTPMIYAEGTHLPLIDLALWEKVQNRWQAQWQIRDSKQVAYSQPPLANLTNPSDINISGANSSGTSKAPYVLQGLLYCSECGSKLVPIHHKTAFQCSGYNHGKCKVSHYVKTDVLVPLVYEAVLSLLPPSTAYYLQREDVEAEEKNRILRLLNRKLVYDKSKKRVQFID